jgi:hypothetical protein
MRNYIQALKLTPMRWFIVLTFIACALALALPPDPQALHLYHLTSLSYRLVIFFLLLPYALIWYAAFYAFAKLSEYTRFLKNAKEEKAFRRITAGMGILAFGLVIPTIISTILNEIAAYHHGFKAADAIISHYIELVVALTSFTYLGSGARMLASSGKIRTSLNGARLFGLIFIIIGVSFTRASVTEHHYAGNPYYLSIFPLVITLVIPYLYTWFIGMICAFDFWLYSKSIKGVLYKKAFSQLSSGLAVTIVGLIAIQFVTSAYGNRTDESLTFILILIYALLGTLILGLSLMALGTNKLKKIEEV